MPSPGILSAAASVGQRNPFTNEDGSIKDPVLYWQWEGEHTSAALPAAGDYTPGVYGEHAAIARDGYVFPDGSFAWMGARFVAAVPGWRGPSTNNETNANVTPPLPGLVFDENSGGAWVDPSNGFRYEGGDMDPFAAGNLTEGAAVTLNNAAAKDPLGYLPGAAPVLAAPIGVIPSINAPALDPLSINAREAAARPIPAGARLDVAAGSIVAQTVLPDVLPVTVADAGRVPAAVGAAPVDIVKGLDADVPQWVIAAGAAVVIAVLLGVFSKGKP